MSAGMQPAIPKTAFRESCVRVGASDIHSFLIALLTSIMISAFVNQYDDKTTFDLSSSDFRSSLHTYQHSRGAKAIPGLTFISPIESTSWKTAVGLFYRKSCGVTSFTFD